MRTQRTLAEQFRRLDREMTVFLWVAAAVLAATIAVLMASLL